MPRRSPVTTNGTVEGITTEVNSRRCEAPKLRATSRLLLSTLRTHRDLHKEGHSFPPRRSSDLGAEGTTPQRVDHRRDDGGRCPQALAFDRSDRKSTRLNSSHPSLARMPSSA